MNCPLYGYFLLRSESGPHLVAVEWNACGLTESSPCDMELRGLDPNWGNCTAYQLALRAARKPIQEIVNLPRKEKRA